MRLKNVVRFISSRNVVVTTSTLCRREGSSLCRREVLSSGVLQNIWRIHDICQVNMSGEIRKVTRGAFADVESSAQHNQGLGFGFDRCHNPERFLA